MVQVKRKNKTGGRREMQQEIGGDVLGSCLSYLKTNVNCTSDISPVENKLHKEDVLFQYSIPTADNNA